VRRAASLLLLFSFACTREATVEKPSLAGAASGFNLVLVSVDTLRADRLGAWGYRVSGASPSPHIDTLLASGVKFEQAMTPRALTWPSLATVLTGLYPSGHGLISNGYRFADHLQTLPLLLRAAGYQTGAFIANMCQANHLGWDDMRCPGGKDGKVIAGARRWLAGADPAQPIFLWAHFFGAHPPYYNGGDRARELDPGYEGTLAPKKEVLDRLLRERADLGARDVAHLNALYDAAVMGTDGLVGELLAALDEAGRRANTLIVFLADHGEDLYQHNRYFYHACSVYQSALHVPLAFIAPGVLPESVTVRSTVELVDVLPTALELLGLPQPPGLHGSSLVPYLERPDRQGPGKAAFSEYDTTRIRTVLHDGYTLISNPDGLAPACMAGTPPDFYPIAELELYDLRSDPGEQHNLVEERPELAAELLARIERRFERLGAPADQQQIPAEVKEELEALGYVTR
jgi:arylsulfatase A-like enzyme